MRKADLRLWRTSKSVSEKPYKTYLKRTYSECLSSSRCLESNVANHDEHQLYHHQANRAVSASSKCEDIDHRKARRVVHSVFYAWNGEDEGSDGDEADNAVDHDRPEHGSRNCCASVA